MTVQPPPSGRPRTMSMAVENASSHARLWLNSAIGLAPWWGIGLFASERSP